MPKGLAFSLPAAGLLLAGLFFLPTYHRLYWSHPLVFVSLTALGAAATLGGGFVAGLALRGRRRIGSGAACALRGLGAALVIPATGLAAAALLLALAIARTGYWGHPPLGYGGDYLPMLLQIRLSQAAAPAGAAGGLLIGLAHRSANASEQPDGSSHGSSPCTWRPRAPR